MKWISLSLMLVVSATMVAAQCGDRSPLPPVFTHGVVQSVVADTTEGLTTHVDLLVPIEDDSPEVRHFTYPGGYFLGGDSSIPFLERKNLPENKCAVIYNYPGGPRTVTVLVGETVVFAHNESNEIVAKASIWDSSFDKDEDGLRLFTEGFLAGHLNSDSFMTYDTEYNPSLSMTPYVSDRTGNPDDSWLYFKDVLLCPQKESDALGVYKAHILSLY